MARAVARDLPNPPKIILVRPRSAGAEHYGDVIKHSPLANRPRIDPRSEEHTSELQSLMRISYAVFCLKKKNNNEQTIAQTYTSYTIYNMHITIHITTDSLT